MCLCRGILWRLGWIRVPAKRDTDSEEGVEGGDEVAQRDLE